MKIGVPKEIKTNENRIALVPAGAEALVGAGHTVLVETGAGDGSGFGDELYTAVGAKIAPGRRRVWRDSRHDHEGEGADRAGVETHADAGRLIFTYFHFAADERLTRAHIDSGAVCIAYETVELPDRELPLLTPMSEVAGRMAVQEGAKYLEKLYGGRGVLLGGVPGVAPAKVVVLGRRRRGHECRQDGGRHGRQGDHSRPVAGAAPVPQRRDAGQRATHPFQPAQHSRADRHGRSGRGRRADCRRQGAEARPA